MTKEEIINNKLRELEKSDFRRNFKLTEKDIKYINDKGIETIKKHAYEIINTRLAGYPIANDGKQTPMRGHPIFTSQHACGCCCRGCLKKWHGIDKNRTLRNTEINYIVEVIIAWIKKQL